MTTEDRPPSDMARAVGLPADGGWMARISRRIWSSRPYALGPIHAVVLGAAAMVLLAVLSALALRPKPKPFVSTYDPNCGIFPTQDRLLAARLSAKATTDIAFLGALSQIEQSGGTEPAVQTQDQISAKRIRLQCGWLHDRTEISESASLQYATWGIDLSGGAVGALFRATQAVAQSTEPLGTFQTNGRFDIAQTLRWSLARPPGDPSLGPEFQPSRDVVASVIDTIRDHRLAYAAAAAPDPTNPS